MLVEKLSNYKYGFVQGNLLSGSLIPDDKASVAVQHFVKGQIIAFWYRKVDTEYYIIVTGKVLCEGKYYTNGDILIYNPFDIRKVIIVEDTDFVVIRTPGTADDYYNYSDSSDSELTEFINSMYSESLIPEKKISNNDISVIVQGPISEITKRTTESIRKHLYGSEIILTTWEGSDVDGIDYDKVFFLKDPGGFSVSYKGKEYTDNTNRQLLSIQEGLRHSSRKYVLKIRSDSLLLGDGIVRYWGIFNKRLDRYKIFSDRIIIGESFNVINRTFDGVTIYTPYMVSDWFYFGLTDDLKKMFNNIPLATKEEMVNYKYKNPIVFHRYMRWNKIFHHRYCAEQYYLINSLHNNGIDTQYEDLSDANDDNIKLSHEIIYNNFAVLNIRQHQIINLKKIEDSLEGANCFKYEKRYSHNDFISDYEKGL